MRCLKKWIWTVFLSLFLLPAGAQEQADTTYTFRFKTGKDMFYVPWNGNDGELARLEACVEKYKTEILGGRMPLHVDGYCCSQPTETENLAMARIRSNRVKSELIVRRELTEECFVTRNHAAEGDFVTVRLTVPVKETAVTDTDAKARCKAEAERLEAEKRAEQERLAEEQRKAEEARLAAEQQTKQAETRPLDSEQTAHSGVSGWYVGLQGGVAGWSFGGKIENCSVSGSVSGSGMNGNAGGVVGSQYKGSITGCSSSATVNAGSTAGGVAGATNNGATLTACYATGSVSVENNATNAAYAGGVVGSNGASTLQACYHAKGAVSGPNGTTGGVAGRNFKDSMLGGGIITACYWGGNGQEQGIGENQAGSTTIETTKVTDGDWSGAKDDMNKALENTVWYYEPYNDGLPVLARTI